MGRTGVEPVTSCLSSKRSKPTELTSRQGIARIYCMMSSCNKSSDTLGISIVFDGVYADRYAIICRQITGEEIIRLFARTHLSYKLSKWALDSKILVRTTDWNTGSNWYGGAVPTAVTNVIIPLTTKQPVISSPLTAICNNMTSKLRCISYHKCRRCTHSEW